MTPSVPLVSFLLASGPIAQVPAAQVPNAFLRVTGSRGATEFRHEKVTTVRVREIAHRGRGRNFVTKLLQRPESRWEFVLLFILRPGLQQPR